MKNSTERVQRVMKIGPSSPHLDIQFLFVSASSESAKYTAVYTQQLQILFKPSKSLSFLPR